MGQVVKNLPANAWYARDVGLIPGSWKSITWRRKWQPIPIFLPGKSSRQKSLVGYSPRDYRVRHDWATEHIYRCVCECVCVCVYRQREWERARERERYTYKQLTLEQHRFELHGFTYRWIFFQLILHYCMIYGWLNLWMWNHRYGDLTVKLYADFPLCVGGQHP